MSSYCSGARYSVLWCSVVVHESLRPPTCLLHRAMIRFCLTGPNLISTVENSGVLLFFASVSTCNGATSRLKERTLFVCLFVQHFVDMRSWSCAKIFRVEGKRMSDMPYPSV
jgi:hypothetical protein